MPRQKRLAPAGYPFHIINRGVGRMPLFETPEDYDAFLRCLAEAQRLRPIKILAYCVMPNHWHLVLQPEADGGLAAFMQRLTITHATRWQEHRQLVGSGHVYQGRYKSFPVEADAHLLAVCRYVERNALRARLVERAEDWRWGSLHQAAKATKPRKADTDDLPTLSDWPVDRPRNWVWRVNQPENQPELDSLRRCVRRGGPFGGAAWTADTIKALGLEFTTRTRGRPRKEEASG